MSNNMLGKKRSSPMSYYDKEKKEELKKEEGELNSQVKKDDHSDSRKRFEQIQKMERFSKSPSPQREINNKNQYYQKPRVKMGRTSEPADSSYYSGEDERRRRYANQRAEPRDRSHRVNKNYPYPPSERTNRNKYGDREEESRRRSYQDEAERDSRNYYNRDIRQQSSIKRDDYYNERKRESYRSQHYQERQERYLRPERDDRMDREEREFGKHQKSMRNDYKESRSNSRNYDISRSLSPVGRKKSVSQHKNRRSSSLEGDQTGRKTTGQMKKRFNFLICLPKNYYSFLEKNYHNIQKDVIFYLLIS
jgi:hypothetical protein